MVAGGHRGVELTEVLVGIGQEGVEQLDEEHGVAAGHRQQLVERLALEGLRHRSSVRCGAAPR